MPVRDRGFALIIVLLAVAGVFGLALHSAAVSRTTTIEARVLRERIVGEREARAAASIALQGLMLVTDEERERIETLAAGGPSNAGAGAAEPGVQLPEMILSMLSEEQRASFEAGAQQVVSEQEAAEAAAALERGGGGDAPRVVGFAFLTLVGLPAAPIDVTIDGSTYRVAMTDAAGLLNVNKADEDQLLAYFDAKGFTPRLGATLTDQLLDWRDADAAPRPLGAETDAYRRRGGVTPRNDRLATLAELRYLPAMTPEIFRAIEADLCLSGDGAVHAGSAPSAVLASVPGLGLEARTRLAELRAAGELTADAFDRVIAPEDDELRERVRAAPSNFVALRVDRIAPPGPKFEGIGVLSDQGVEHIGLRPR